MHKDDRPRVLLAHCYYQLRGGEDVVFETERDMLRSNGHAVIEYSRRNDEVSRMSPWRLACETAWNAQSYREIRQLIRDDEPDVAHFHNILPRISPSAYYACRDEGVPVVQTLHNYRTMCLNALLFREGALCERCVGMRFAWPGVRYCCYRHSRFASAAVAAMTAYHWRKRTWQTMVDRYVCLTPFSIEKHREAGLPAEKLYLKRNYLPDDPGYSKGPSQPLAIYVGRLSQEKGVEFLLSAWSSSKLDVPLWVVGDGPLRGSLESRFGNEGRIRFLGGQPRAEVLALLAQASVLIVSSLWYEGFPMTILESLAVGTPVLAPRLGGMADVPSLGAGRSYAPGDADDLLTQAETLINVTKATSEHRGRARAAFESYFDSKCGYEGLMRLYAEVCALSQERSRHG